MSRSSMPARMYQPIRVRLRISHSAAADGQAAMPIMNRRYDE